MVLKRFNTLLILIFTIWGYSNLTCAQEVTFFTDGTDNNFYDQGIVEVNTLGSSTFEHTYPPGGSPTKWNDKVPCSTNAFAGLTSLKFNYMSSASGNWKVRIHRNDWSAASITGMDSLSFYVYADSELPASALPLIGLNTARGGTKYLSISEFNETIPKSTWTRITLPLSIFLDDVDNRSLSFSETNAVLFGQSENNNSARNILIDEIKAFKSFTSIPKVENLKAVGYDSHAELSWDHPGSNLTYRVYASFNNGLSFELRNETSENSFMDFVPPERKNSTSIYRVVSLIQNTESDPVEQSVTLQDFSDDELMNMVQEYSFRYFWEGAHQASGMSLERSNGNGKTAASGATGMGLMAMIVAHEREYRPKDEVKDRILKILNFLETCDRHHGAWSHWYNADTKKTQQFGTNDDGGDLVETSFVAQALIALKNYFSQDDAKSVQIRETSDRLWKEIEWSWYRQGGQNTLYWHWSPNTGFIKNMQVRGWNEALITYVMAAASPSHGIPKEVYTQGWTRNGSIVNRRRFYNNNIYLSPNWGGPLFWLHYTHHGINPHGLKDASVDYWTEFVNTAKIHYEYAKDNPLDHKNYGENCWGLTASDDPDGYTAHQPLTNDNGTISPTAALACMPYTPEESMKALKYFYRDRGVDLFGKYGPYDAFNDDRSWVKESYIGIDQGPIVIMIENHRSALLWKYVMMDADVQAGLDKLGFDYQINTGVDRSKMNSKVSVYPNPCVNQFTIQDIQSTYQGSVNVSMYSVEGRQVFSKVYSGAQKEIKIDCSNIPEGLYLVHLNNGTEKSMIKLVVSH